MDERERLIADYAEDAADEIVTICGNTRTGPLGLDTVSAIVADRMRLLLAAVDQPVADHIEKLARLAWSGGCDNAVVAVCLFDGGLREAVVLAYRRDEQTCSMRGPPAHTNQGALIALRDEIRRRLEGHTKSIARALEETR